MGILDMVAQGGGQAKEKASWLSSTDEQSFIGKVTRFEERTHENRKSKYFGKPFVILELEVVSGTANTIDGPAPVRGLVCYKLEMAPGAGGTGTAHAFADLYDMVTGIMGLEVGAFRGLTDEAKVDLLAPALGGDAVGRLVHVGTSAPNEGGWRKLQFSAIEEDAEPAAKPARRK